MDAAVHRGLDERTNVFVLDGALVLGIARRVEAKAHGLVLQIAFAALIADRAVERMIDEQEFHHAFARLLHHRSVGEDLRCLAVGTRAQIAHSHGARGGRLRRTTLHLDQAHAAVAGDRQTFVEAKTRHFRARGFARLQECVLRRDIDFRTVNDDLGHRVFLSLSCFTPRSSTAQMPKPVSYSAAMRTGSLCGLAE